MASLQGYVDRRIFLVLQDGRAIVVCISISPRFLPHHLLAQGKMAGYDQRSNIVISECKERVYSIEDGVEEIPLGLYLVKGDMMCVTARSFVPWLMTLFSILIGEIDDAIDQSVDLSTIRAEPIPPLRY